MVTIECQKKLRNDCAHGGIVQRKADAERAIEDIIVVGKLLAKIVYPEFLLKQ